MKQIVWLLLPFLLHTVVSDGTYLLVRDRVPVLLQTFWTNALTLPLLLYWYHKDEHKESGEKASKRRISGGNVLLWIGAGAAANGLFTVLMRFVPGANRLSADVQEALLLGNPALQVVTLVFLAPVTEELLFRGLFYRRLQSVFGHRMERSSSKLLAAILSAGLFALSHGNLLQAVFAFPMGLLLAAILEREQSIAAPVCMHLGSNLLTVLMRLIQG